MHHLRPVGQLQLDVVKARARAHESVHWPPGRDRKPVRRHALQVPHGNLVVASHVNSKVGAVARPVQVQPVSTMLVGEKWNLWREALGIRAAVSITDPPVLDGPHGNRGRSLLVRVARVACKHEGTIRIVPHSEHCEGRLGRRLYDQFPVCVPSGPKVFQRVLQLTLSAPKVDRLRRATRPSDPVRLPLVADIRDEANLEHGASARHLHLRHAEVVIHELHKCHRAILASNAEAPRPAAKRSVVQHALAVRVRAALHANVIDLHLVRVDPRDPTLLALLREIQHEHEQASAGCAAEHGTSRACASHRCNSDHGLFNCIAATT
mmetsp:Transcript_95017/g.238301  ORF Transcript_95017/g.238301 Transcript_95017/m.238301 type:complete len:322 (-) Transcript_95017:12-977(-)